MPEIVGKDGTVSLTESRVRLLFDRQTADTGKLDESPRDIPLTSISGVELSFSSWPMSSSMRLILVGDLKPPRGASTDINSILIPSGRKHEVQWEAFVELLSTEIAAAVPKIPLSDQLPASGTHNYKFARATYLGGLPGTEPITVRSRLVVTSDQICVETGQLPLAAVISWADCDGVTIEGGELAQSRVAATVLFGIAGLAMKSRIDRVLITVHKRDRSAAVYQIENVAAQVVTSTLGPLFHELEIPFNEEIAATGRTEILGDSTPIELLERLGKLRDAGVLTEEEFMSKKTELLGRI